MNNFLSNQKSLTNCPLKVDTKKKQPSVFCIVKTHPDNIATNKTLTVLDVWVQKCDNYRFTYFIFYNN